MALEWTDLAIVKRKCFEELLAMFPSEKFKMHKYVQQKLNQLKQDQHDNRQRAETQMLAFLEDDEMKLNASDSEEESEGNQYGEWLSEMREQLSSQAYKDPLDDEKEAHMRRLEAKFINDLTLGGIEKLFQQIKSMKYQWLMHLNADQKNREYIDNLPDEDEAYQTEDKEDEDKVKVVLDDVVNWEKIKDDKN